MEIIVSDTGCGISSDKLESIFREFEQVEPVTPPSSKPQGLGMSFGSALRPFLTGRLQD